MNKQPLAFDTKTVKPAIASLWRFKRVILLASCFLLPSQASSQVRSGGIVVMGRSRQGIMLAADSRVNLGNGKYQDTACRIAALGDKLIFAAAGIMSDDSAALPENLRFDVTMEARRAFLLHSLTPENLPDLGIVGTIASNWGLNISKHLRAAAEASPANLQEWLKRIDVSRESSFVVGIFAGIEADGGLSVYLVHVDLAPPTQASAAKESYFLTAMLVPGKSADSLPLLTPFGMTEIVNEINDGKTDRAKHEIDTLHNLQNTLSAETLAIRQAIRMVDLTIAYHPQPEFVGGSIDAIELPHSGKVRWVQRKEICPPN
jgi:hypothetical protein